ncbi:L,D-transpeptidase family protein [Bacteriovoracaceae bacterium]|nr:L,D-transpeptidase family protein [Bacteriovoracaceae bacterium]
MQLVLNLKKSRKLLLSSLLIFHIAIYAQDKTDFKISNLIKLSNLFSHHVLIVEKDIHKISIFENVDGNPRLVKTFPIATGKKTGDKFEQGDYKTPEGIYNLTDFYSNDYLAKKYGKVSEMYGAGAFTLNYPNFFDANLRKTGGGIWLHSTDNNARISLGLDSRGCVVVTDKNLKEIANFIDLKNTPIIIVHELKYLSKESFSLLQTKIEGSIKSWMNAWKNKDISTYLSHYHPQRFKSSRGNYKAYGKYKTALFANKNLNWEINFENLSILNFKDYVIATFTQDYQSPIIKDIGKKVLYLVKDKNYQWKIVKEEWSKFDQSQNYAFTPGQRFFNLSSN